MAIVEMKRLSLLAPLTDQKKLMGVLQRVGCVEVTAQEAADGFTACRGLSSQDADETITRVRWAVDRLSHYDTSKKPLFADKPSIDYEEADKLLNQEQSVLMNTVRALETLERESGDLRGRSTKIASLKEALDPWKSLTAPLSEIGETRSTITLLGTMPKSAFEELEASGKLGNLCLVRQVSQVQENLNLQVLMHKSAAEETEALLKDAGFAKVSLGNFSGTVDEELARLEQEEKEIEARQQAIIQETASHVDQLESLKRLYDVLCSEREQKLAMEKAVCSKTVFYAEGWAPDTAEEEIRKRVVKVSPSAALEFTEPAEDEEPPVLLNNSPVVTPYETIVSGFSLPAYHGFDPTNIMMPFFANFMGMMISDAGYGLLLVLFIPIIIKLCKPGKGMRNLMWILFGGGIATVIWGALYNTWFGFAPWPSLFDPMNEALPVMGICVAMGAIHLFAGLGYAAYMNIKRGKPLDAIADQLSWFLLVLGLILMVLPMFASVPESISEAGKYMAIVGAGIVLVTAGREKSKNPIKRLISGLGALYGATSWVSDLLSYMRLFGMGLATGVIGMVFNQLIGMVAAGGPVLYPLVVVLFVFCHAFNMAINVLGAYVHSCRLQYIEFFGKFYEDGGRPFKPLQATSRYCYIREAEETSAVK